MTETTAAGALADTSKLDDIEGLPVRQVGLEIPGAAGGLRDPLRVEPQQWRKGERLYVCLELEVAKLRFDSIDKDNPIGDQRRVHITEVLGAAIVDRDLIAPALAETKRRVELAQEAAAGIGRLPVDDEAAKAHEDGLHASGLVPGCPLCESETEAAANEAAAETPPPAPTPIAGRAAKATAERQGRSS